MTVSRSSRGFACGCCAAHSRDQERAPAPHRRTRASRCPPPWRARSAGSRPATKDRRIARVISVWHRRAHKICVCMPGCILRFRPRRLYKGRGRGSTAAAAAVADPPMQPNRLLIKLRLTSMMPWVLRPAITSSRVVLPAPEAPMRQTSWPGVTMPLTSFNSCKTGGTGKGTRAAPGSRTEGAATMGDRRHGSSPAALWSAVNLPAQRYVYCIL